MGLKRFLFAFVAFDAPRLMFFTPTNVACSHQILVEFSGIFYLPLEAIYTTNTRPSIFEDTLFLQQLYYLHPKFLLSFSVCVSFLKLDVSFNLCCLHVLQNLFNRNREVRDCMYA